MWLLSEICISVSENNQQFIVEKSDGIWSFLSIPAKEFTDITDVV